MLTSPARQLRALARRYRELERAGHVDGLLMVLCGAGAAAMAGIVLLASLQTHVVLVLALTLMLAATIAVLVTVLVMLDGDDPSPPAGERSPRQP
jgi:hypothetical protein